MPSTEQALKWCMQMAEALAYVHSKGIRQSDISYNNFLLDHDDNIKICDFGGSQIDGGEFYCCSEIYGEGPYTDGEDDYEWKSGDGPIPIVRELFGLGSVMYEVFTGLYPYERENEKLENPVGTWKATWQFYTDRYRAHEYPDVKDLSCGNVILGCWNGVYTSADEVRKALMKLIEEKPTTKSSARVEEV